MTPTALEGATIAVIGYGSQGRAHARNLRDSGFEVIVGARAGRRRRARAKADGFRVGDAGRGGEGEPQLVALLTPDMSHREVYAHDIAPNLAAGDTLLVAHGFSVLYGEVAPRARYRRRAGRAQGPGRPRPPRI